jgi:urease accessory protein UreF
MVSAAVRLSLVGPLASIPLLHKVQGAAEDGWKTSWIAMEEDPNPLSAAAACAPVVEALHPCHDVLQLRLFRT